MKKIRIEQVGVPRTLRMHGLSSGHADGLLNKNDSLKERNIHNVNLDNVTLEEIDEYWQKDFE